eukprot:749937-Prorocentrum_lima.AAC.1
MPHVATAVAKPVAKASTLDRMASSGLTDLLVCTNEAADVCPSALPSSPSRLPSLASFSLLTSRHL